VASYLTIIKTPNLTLATLLYACVLCSLLFIFYKLPQFFAVEFNPGFAGLTFPMAIGIVASARMSGFLKNQGMEDWANIVGQIQGIQIYVTTAIIGFVLFNFVKHLKNC
jgi:exfoliative toxin A/B